MNKFTPCQTERLIIIYREMFSNLFEVKGAISSVKLSKTELEALSKAIEYCEVSVVGEIMMANIETELKRKSIEKLAMEEKESK